MLIFFEILWAEVRLQGCLHGLWYIRYTEVCVKTSCVFQNWWQNEKTLSYVQHFNTLFAVLCILSCSYKCRIEPAEAVLYDRSASPPPENIWIDNKLHVNQSAMPNACISIEFLPHVVLWFSWLSCIQHTASQCDIPSPNPGPCHPVFSEEQWSPFEHYVRSRMTLLLPFDQPCFLMKRSLSGIQTYPHNITGIIFFSVLHMM